MSGSVKYFKENTRKLCVGRLRTLHVQCAANVPDTEAQLTVIRFVYMTEASIATIRNVDVYNKFIKGSVAY